MSDDARAQVEAELRALREAYLAELPELIERLAFAAGRGRRDPPDQSAREQAAIDAHRIHGTAGSLGLTAVSEAAARVGEALEPLAKGTHEPDDPLWDRVDAAIGELLAAAEA